MVDYFATNGVRFTNAYSECPVCIPARRALMTGLSAKSHGDRSFQSELPMPDVPTLAGAFASAGYYTYAVGKLHVFPQRDRIGFDDVLLNEEGRHLGEMTRDDWERHLEEAGYAGMEYAAGGSNNDYNVTPWHLPDALHQTSWTAREMGRAIVRRDPKRPAFWYLSFAAPHPPLWPLRSYLEQYQNIPIDPPVVGDWVENYRRCPPVKWSRYRAGRAVEDGRCSAVDLARRAFYAMITHIDNQIRAVVGTLHEEGVLENTVIAMTSDHGDMLGDHGLWAKTVMYESSAKVPFVVFPAPRSGFKRRGTTDDRLVELRDMMPTLLDLAGVPIPDHVEGIPAFSDARRELLYGEHGEGVMATRMIRDARHKHKLKFVQRRADTSKW